jgi:lauroyl/myristoyl acyltransferase
MRTEEQDPTLAQLADHLVAWPPAPRMPPASPRVWLKTARPVRAVMPTRLVVAHAERKGRRLWDEAKGERADALRTMAIIVSGTAEEERLQDHARRHLIERQAWDALFWQAWPAPRVSEVTRERLISLCNDAPRGVVLSACHLGPYFRKSKTLVSLGIEPHVVAGDWFHGKPTRDYWGRRLARWQKGLPEVPLVRPRGSFPVLQMILRAGKTVLVYFDMPGGHETRFLGKPAMLVDGTARLAATTDALIVPVRSRRDGRMLWLDALEPLDPRDFAGADELHEELARVHERLILEFPAGMADPGSFGWGEHATAAAWRRPPREQDERAGDAARVTRG